MRTVKRDLGGEDPYAVLNVSPSSTPQEISEAYRRKAREWHPDKNSNSNANQQMALINQVYEVLSNPRKRAEYDRERLDMFSRKNATSTTEETDFSSDGATSRQATSAPASRDPDRSSFADLFSVWPLTRRRRRMWIRIGISLLIAVVSAATWRVVGVPHQSQQAGFSPNYQPMVASTESTVPESQPTSADEPSPTASPASATPVATPPADDFLSNSDYYAGSNTDFEYGSDEIDGKPFGENSLKLCSDLAVINDVNCAFGKGTEYWVEYNLGRSHSWFVATVGLADTSPSDCNVSATVAVDKNQVFSQDLVVGKSFDLRIPIEQKLRLHIGMTPWSGNARCYVVFGDARMVH